MEKQTAGGREGATGAPTPRSSFCGSQNTLEGVKGGEFGVGEHRASGWIKSSYCMKDLSQQEVTAALIGALNS